MCCISGALRKDINSSVLFGTSCSGYELAYALYLFDRAGRGWVGKTCGQIAANVTHLRACYLTVWQTLPEFQMKLNLVGLILQPWATHLNFTLSLKLDFLRGCVWHDDSFAMVGHALYSWQWRFRRPHRTRKESINFLFNLTCISISCDVAVCSRLSWY